MSACVCVCPPVFFRVLSIRSPIHQRTGTWNGQEWKGNWWKEEEREAIQDRASQSYASRHVKT